MKKFIWRSANRWVVLPSGVEVMLLFGATRQGYSIEAARGGAVRSYIYHDRPVVEHAAIAAAEAEAHDARRGLIGRVHVLIDLERVDNRKRCSQVVGLVLRSADRPDTLDVEF